MIVTHFLVLFLPFLAGSLYWFVNLETRVRLGGMEKSRVIRTQHGIGIEGPAPIGRAVMSPLYDGGRYRFRIELTSNLQAIVWQSIS